MSFAYRSGLPREADMVFDVRFLANPALCRRAAPADTASIRRCAPTSRPIRPIALLMERLEALLLPLLPSYQREGKSYLTIAFGCTGGRHRSIVVAEAFAGRLRELRLDGRSCRHRDTPGNASPEHSSEPLSSATFRRGS